MPGSFLDTNVLLYVASEESKKADRAEEILAAGGTISVQVLNEVVNVARRKMRMSWEDISRFLAAVRNLATVAPLTVETHEVGIALAERYGFATYDAMIVASALLSDCDILWSEDMQHGMAVDGRLRIANPFRGF
jgi:predicted nucleic acid-binding protein